MKATKLIAELQQLVNEHGDFDLNAGYFDDDFSYQEHLQSNEFDITVNWDDRDNDWHGGWICIERLHEEECDCMYDGMDYNDYEIEQAIKNMED